MTARICVIPGDGIGHEVVPAALDVLTAAGVEFDITEAEAGWDCFTRTGTALPAETLEFARASDAILFGAVSSPLERADGYTSPIVSLRRELDLYACVRPLVPLNTAPEVRLIVLRENTEGLYAGLEHEDSGRAPGDRRAVAERVVTEQASRRLARTAIELARHHALRQVTVVHKANVLRTTCGLFREVVLDELARAPDLEIAEGLVDSAACRLAGDPSGFGVIITTNLFGDILSDVAAVHAGGLGMVESINLGEHHALFEPVHGSAPGIAGTERSNPLATVRAAARLAEHIGQPDAAARVLVAVHAVQRHGPHTPDLGGSASTHDITAAVMDALPAALPV
jgi:homoisocitrate dehydrogenase